MDCPGTGFFIPGRGDQFRGGLQAQSVNRRSFISSTLSSPAMALTVDSTEWLAARTVSGVMLSKAKIRCSFSPSALRMCESAVCYRATDSMMSVMACSRVVVLGVITGIPIVIPAPLQRELGCCSCHSMRCDFKKSQPGLRAPYKKYLRSRACRNPDVTDCSPPETELFSQMQHSVTEKPVRPRENESSSGYCE